MATKLSEVIQHLRSALLRDVPSRTDGQLLEEFLSGRDEGALAALVHRHGPMVWGVCRRILHNHHDAEDAFQATFLVLVRKAALIATPDLIANWLYGVAHQTALKARATTAKRRARERQVTEMPQPAVRSRNQQDDLRSLLDEELSRLPGKYRVAIILCELEGKTRKEAAQQLGVPEGTLAARLARGRVMLAKRFARKGLVLPAGMLIGVLAQCAAEASVPVAVVLGTLEATARYAAGTAAGVGAVSGKVVVLTDQVMKSLMLARLGGMAYRMLAVWLVVAGVGLGVACSCAPDPGKQPVGPLQSGPDRAKEQPTALRLDKQTGKKVRLQGLEIEAGTDLYALSIAPDSRRVAVGGFEKGLGLWQKGSERIGWTAGGASGAAITFSRDGRQLALAVAELPGAHVRLMDPVTGQEKQRAMLPKGVPVEQLLFLPDAKSLLAVVRDQTLPGPPWSVYRWRLNEKQFELVKIVEGSEPLPFPRRRSTAVLRPDGQRLATTRGDGRVLIWDIETGNGLQTIDAHAEAAAAVAWSADGSLLATAGLDGRVRVWDAQSGQSRAELRASSGPVTSVAFGPEGKLLAAGFSAVDKQGRPGVTLWSWVAKQELATQHLGRGDEEVRAVSLAGQFLAAITQNGTVAIWSLHASDQRPAQAEADPNGGAAARKVGEKPMAQERLVFYLGGDPVGVFSGADYPTTPGRVEYDPFRSEGHANMSAALKQGKRVRCWFSCRGKRVGLDITREDFVLGPPGGKSHWYLELAHLDGNDGS